MKIETACRRLVDEFSSRPTMRAGSLITTVFGDSIAPRGGSLWLGSLIKLMACFGVGERLVRTSVYRLVQDAWLESEQIGRRSYYRLTREGSERFQQATHRIYGEPNNTWDGNWCLLLLSNLDTASKEVVRKECAWLGFGALSANVLAHPSPDIGDLDITIQRLGLVDDLIVLRGQTLRNEAGMQRLAHSSWNLAERDREYAAFINIFRRLVRPIDTAQEIQGEQAFILRTLLIQEYRKILLRDPLLPAELLPQDWRGSVAYQLCRNLYNALHVAADRHLSTVVETAQGPLPPAEPSFVLRFGGLQTSPPHWEKASGE